MHPICHIIIIVNFTGTPLTWLPCDVIRKLSIRKWTGYETQLIYGEVQTNYQLTFSFCINDKIFWKKNV